MQIKTTKENLSYRIVVFIDLATGEQTLFEQIQLQIEIYTGFCNLVPIITVQNGDTSHTAFNVTITSEMITHFVVFFVVYFLCVQK